MNIESAYPKAEYCKVSEYVNLEWLEPGKVAMFRSHIKPYEDKPAPIDGACVVHIYSKAASEIKGLASKHMGGAKMISGYKAILRAMAGMGYSGVKLELFNEDGSSRVWIDGKLQKDFSTT